LVICARTQETLEAAAEDIRKASGAKVTAIACDITTDEGRAAVLNACPEPDILVNNAGGPPPGDFRDWERDDWIKALDGNMLTAIFLIKATIDGMIDRKFGRIVNITSSSVKLPVPYLGMSNGARTGLTGFVAGLARQTVPHNVTINGLLPGRFETQRLIDNMKINAEKAGRNFDDLYAESIESSTAKRFGTPKEFGMACAYLCSAHSGYITGQNLLMDGGAFNSSI
jgi:3-oxoacyl-[acyl-carrier protein] reductase